MQVTDIQYSIQYFNYSHAHIKEKFIIHLMKPLYEELIRKWVMCETFYDSEKMH